MNFDGITSELLWSQKYRPQKISDTILPEKTKAAFQKFVDEGNITVNLLLTGSPGTGKTTAAMAMLKELGCDYIVINGSLNNGIDMLRSEISRFASSVSFSGGRKYIIIDESDNLTQAAQAGLRNAIEEYSANCGFIFTCNFKNRIIAPLRSRFSEVDFAIDKAEKPKLASQFLKRVLHILNTEEVDFDKDAVVKSVMKYFPDFRRVLNELQGSAATGRIDETMFLDVKKEPIDTLFDLMKEKKFTELRKWVANNSDQDANELFRRVYDVGIDKIELASQPGFILILADYMFKHGQVADPEINFMAFVCECMIELEFV